MKIKKAVSHGFIEVSDLAKIVYEMAQDIAALKVAVENHQHVENTAGTYTQNASVSKTTTVVALKTSLES